MDVLIFNPWVDIKFVKSWLKLRDMDESLAEDLPQIGYMAFVGDLPVAAGFLRQVEGNAAQIDSVITDPKADPKIRNEAIDAIVERLIDFARKDGVKMILSFSIDAHTLERSKKHGFKQLPHTVITLDLQGGDDK